MLGLKSTVSAACYCRGYDELRNFLRCRSHMRRNMFPLSQCGAGDICGKPRLSSLSWAQQLECAGDEVPKLVQLKGAKTGQNP